MFGHAIHFTAAITHENQLAFDIDSNKGFILISVLLVVSLLTVLLVSAVVLAQIELQSNDSAVKTEMARQNALFGLSQALGQLQCAAGSDRRTTARADIIGTNTFSIPSTYPTAFGYSGNSPATDNGQSYWTGVWKNTSNDYAGCAGNGLTSNPDSAPGQVPGPGGSFIYYDYFPNGSPNSTSGSTALSSTQPPSRAQLYNPANVTWLISWPASSPIPDPTAPLAGQLGNVAFPLANNSANTLSGNSLLVPLIQHLNTTTSANPSLSSAGSTNSVSAPLVPILAKAPGASSSATVGAYAYWVSDEGVKAKINVTDPYLAVSPSSPSNYLTAQLHLQTSQGSAANQALAFNSPGGFNASSAIDIRSSSAIVDTLASATYADAAGSWGDFATNPNTYVSDFSVDSLGVIADNFNGGLRKDLTAGLENQNVWWSNFSNFTKNPTAPYNPTEQAEKLYSVNAINGGTFSQITNSGICLDGLRWDSFFLYYNLYKVQMPSPCNCQLLNAAYPLYGYNGIGSQGTYGIPGSGVNALPILTARQYQETNNGIDKLEIDPIYPRLALWSHNVSAALHEIQPPNPVNATSTSNGTAGSYDLYLYSSPIMVLYNPWDVNIQEPVNGTALGSVDLYSNISATDAADYNRFIVNNSIIPTPHKSAPGTSGVTDPGNLGGLWIRTTSVAGTDTAFMPGELRVYGLTANSMASSAPFSTAGYPNSALPCAICNTSVVNTSPELMSQGYAFGNYRGFEATMVTTPLSAFHTDSISVAGDQTIRATTEQLTLDNYCSWPNMALTTIAPPTEVDTPHFPQFGSSFAGPSVPLTTVGNLISCGTSDPPTPILVASLVDRMPGVYNTEASVTIGVATGTYQSAFPGLVSGGAFFNPLAIDTNSYTRDYFNTGKLATLNSSQSDVQITSFPASGPLPANSYVQTGWLPDSVGRSTFNTNVVLRTIPRQPLISLGQFKNMTCHYFLVGSSDGSGQLNFSFYPLGGSYQQGLPTNVAFAFGTAATEINSGAAGANTLYQDDNFLSNEALFDGYFLSTVPPSSFNSALGWSDSQAWPSPTSTFDTLKQSYVDSNLPLPSGRLIYYRRSQSTSLPSHGNPPTPDSSSPNYVDLQCPNTGTANVRKPAANLLINGAFNINSTSVPAWEALLSSSSGANVKVSALTTSPSVLPAPVVANQSLISFASTESPFVNFFSPIWISTSATPAPNTALFGLVKLTNLDIATLAKNIVYQIQARGPALSLGDFLNRSHPPFRPAAHQIFNLLHPIIPLSVYQEVYRKMTLFRL